MLAPGSYQLSARGRLDVPLVVIDVPAGFESGGDFLVVSGEAFGAMGYWRVTGTYTDPCTKRGTAYDIGDTVDDLAEVLTSQGMLSPTRPRPTSVGGHDGTYLELTAPRINYEKCQEEDVGFWLSDEGDLYSDTPGVVVGVWILDVAKERLVLNTYLEPKATEQQDQALIDVVNSARFTKTDASAIL